MLNSKNYLLFVVSLFGYSHLHAMSCDEVFHGVQTKEAIAERVSKSSNYKSYKFVKDLPIVGYQIQSSKYSDLPDSIRSVLGAVDATKYTEEYLGKNVGSVIALQMNGNDPDFYVIGMDTFLGKYKLVDLGQVATKNPKLVSKLLSSSVSTLFEANDSRLVGLLKTAPVEMIRMSEVGFPISQSITIESPWGEQTKPAEQDAFLVFDAAKNQYYMINIDSNGLPIGYIPAI